MILLYMLRISGFNREEVISILMSIVIVFSTVSIAASQIPFVDAETVASGKCNCILDSTTYASTPSNNMTGLTIPRVKLIKNETLESKTEGHLTWNTLKDTQLLGLLSENFFLGNFSRGTGASVALNTLKVKQNESLGIQITGGRTPAQVKAEIIKATVNKNGTLGEIKTLGPKVAEIPIQYDKATKKPTLDKNSFPVKVPEHGDYLLLIELTYNNKNQPSKHLIAAYELVLVA
jgi:hypothetical protein